MPAATGVFEALGDPARRRALELLAAGEQPAGVVVQTLRAELGISQPATSQHLRVLREAGLVSVRAEGNRRLYEVSVAGVSAAGLWLAGLLPDAVGAAYPAQALDQPLDALATEVARGRRARRAAPAVAAAGADGADEEPGVA